MKLFFLFLVITGAITAGVGAEPATTQPMSGTTAPVAKPALFPPAATTRNVGNDDRQKYLLALWADRRERIAANAPPARPRTGVAVKTPAFEDGSPSGATLVTVHGAGTLLHALIQVAESGKVRIAANEAGLFHRDGTPDIAVDLNNKPLWEAIYEICSSANLDVIEVEAPPGAGTKPVAPDATGRIVLGPQSPGHVLGTWSTNGPFLYEVQRLEHSIDWEGGKGEEHRMEMILRAWAEPKLRVLAGPGRILLDQVVDENENSLVPLAAEDNVVNLGREIRIKLAYPQNAGRTIARFRATDRCLVQRASERVELPAPETPVKRTVEGMNVLVKKDEEQNNVYRVSVTVERGERGEIDWSHLHEAMGDLHPQLLTAAGVSLRFLSATNESARGDVNAVSQYTWLKEGSGGAVFKPAKLIFELPTDVKAIDVPIAFDNLPLP